jgi:hypothetical protein
MLQLMTPAEVAEIARGGIDVQLHTHRHRTPFEEQLFAREVRDNRKWLSGVTGRHATHFCYPSGVYSPEFWPWLRAEGVVSATTCDPGIATPSSERLLLPRFLDSMSVSDLEFEGWLCGFSSCLPHRRRRTQRGIVSSGSPASRLPLPSEAADNPGLRNGSSLPGPGLQSGDRVTKSL